MRAALAGPPWGWSIVGVNVSKMDGEDISDLATQAWLEDPASCEGFCLYDVTFSLADSLRPFIIIHKS